MNKMKTLKDLVFDVSAVDDYATVWKTVDWVDVLYPQKRG